ncbi:MAG: sigma-70 family RNA polymerase sigma factor [Fibrobacterales bacterium]
MLDTSFESVYNQYSNLVYRVCLRYTREVETVQDLVQEIFLKAYKNIDAFNSQSQPGTWLHKIAVNHCIDYYRKCQRNREDSVDYLEDIFEDPRFMTSKQADAKMTLEKIFKSLSGELKEVVVLSFVEGLSHQEIADQLKQDRSSVSKKIKNFQKSISDHRDVVFNAVLVLSALSVSMLYFTISSPNGFVGRLINMFSRL